MRVPHFAVLFLGTWLPFFFFGVDVPFTQALVYVPIVMVAVTLPITPQGVGTRDVVAAWAFARFAQGDTPAAQTAAITAATTARRGVHAGRGGAGPPLDAVGDALGGAEGGR